MLTALVAKDSTTGLLLFKTVGDLSDRILSYAIALAAVGALTMALIEAWKKLMDTRTKFHAGRWTVVMLPREIMTSTNQRHLEQAASRRVAYEQLLQLCTGASAAEAQDAREQLEMNGTIPLWHALNHSPAYAAFAQETVVMIAIIQDAVDIALAAAPGMYGELFDVMTEGAQRKDIDLWRGRDKVNTQDPQQARELSNAFGRIRQVAKRKLDGFQIYTLERWAAGNQVAGIVLGAVVMTAAIALLAWDHPRLMEGAGPIELGVLALTGGLLSPVAKDLVTALKRVKE